MFLHDIRIGDKLNLELIIDNKSYIIPNQAIATQENQVWIDAFQFGGAVIDFSNKKFANIRFHLHGYNAKKVPFCWKNVQLTLDDHEGRQCYLVTCKQFHSMGSEENRRNEQRVLIKTNADMQWRKGGYSLPVALRDISDSGVAFVSPQQMNLKGEHLVLELNETVLANKYWVKMECVCVRIEKKENHYLYGCKFQVVDQKLLQYVFSKRMEARAKELAEQKQSTK
jgi:c-di-GMP-binding flagellar brake protein YcgR